MSIPKGLKLCCYITTLILFIFTITVVTLSLTIFKPKQPNITARPIGLENIQFNGTYPNNVTLDVTLSVLITIDNRNYGGFEYKNSTGYINYRGILVAEVPIEHKVIPARSKVNITTTTDVMADKLILDPDFWADLEAGLLNLTSTATLHGKLSVMKILRLHATAYSTCDISIFIQSRDIKSKCNSRIKL
ncbi:uncharacterized protein LOC116204390 [Punica granatum]|uniref:Late embryogenesis abundant protein LEA-2 subgroup domain-containing protein n=2 Tax=Punica granatum TaxID=22663 RepID=A0A218X631_PUNGR|nr:uncharacterized protein LOC116204390 [Punica granatum]OWM79832.1 hypothetical protein CDL15_Pgr023244 [Punica granatum]PKI49182.1 hypothetical protein CRG98_030430 [Punica granatum]